MMTQDYLKECMVYYSADGIFIWNIRPLSHFKNQRDYNRWNGKYSHKKAGSVATKENRIRINGRLYTASKLAWLYVYGEYYRRNLMYKDGNCKNVRIENIVKRDKSV
jgi:hypothetical protein